MDKTILVFSIIVACAIGIVTGLSLGAIQTGEMSGQINQMIKSISNDFSSSSQISGVTNNVQNAINSAKIAFGFTVLSVDPDKIPNSTDEFLINAISSCVFHSDTSIQTNTCVVCTLQNESKETLASGKINLLKYESSSNISIPITDKKYEGANNVLNVHGVTVEVCQQGNGCSVEFWKNHLGLWSNTGYRPEDKFRFVFGIGNNEPFKVTYKSQALSDPTLLQALNAEGDGISALTRNAVASLLNSKSNFNFPITEENIVISFYQAFLSKNYESAKDIFSQVNP